SCRDGWIPRGSQVVVSCVNPSRSGSQYPTWYKIVRGAPSQYNGGNWQIAGGTTNTPNRPSGMPNC
ncbi:MAG: hypothetical protein ABW204_10060, partial [Microbacteriaceae bacterium]